MVVVAEGSLTPRKKDTSSAVEVQQVNYRQAQMPVDLIGTFVANDGDDHDFIFRARGKSKLTVHFNNAGDQALTVKLYGSVTPTLVATTISTPVAVAQIGGNVTIAAANAGTRYITADTPFPFYIVRVTSAAAQTGDPTVTVSAFMVSG